MTLMSPRTAFDPNTNPMSPNRLRGGNTTVDENSTTDQTRATKYQSSQKMRLSK